MTLRGDLLDYLLYLLIGAAAGLLAGLFGIGGGVIIVTVLIFSFSAQGFSSEVITHLAIGTSLATIVVTSLSSIYSHNKKRAINWRLFAWLTTGIAAGAVAGGLFAQTLPGEWLQFGFGLFLIAVGVQMGFPVRARDYRPPDRLTLAGAGGVIGYISALFGIGGGSLTVPYLAHRGLPIREAVATSAACGLPVALFGALTFGFGAAALPSLPEGSWGFVYLPALLGIVVASAPAARVGAWLAHRLDPNRLRQWFALSSVLFGTRFAVVNGANLWPS